MQAIETKAIPATNTKPTRIKATCAAGSLTVSWDSIDVDQYDQKHNVVASYLVKKLGWKHVKDIHTGCLKNGNFVHVLEIE